MSRALSLDPEWDRDFTVGVGVSALLHVLAAGAILFLAARAPQPPPPLESYTVELTDPSALGGRLAFGPLDRPLGRPRRIADASGGAPAGAPNPGETAPAKMVELPKAAVPPPPPKPAVPPKPVEPQSAVEEAKPVESPKPPEAPTPTQPPATVPPPAAAAPPQPVEPLKPPTPPAPKEPEVRLPNKPKPPENLKPPEPVAEPKPEPKPAPAPQQKPVAEPKPAPPPEPKPAPVAAKPEPVAPPPPVHTAKAEAAPAAKTPEPPQQAIRPAANPSRPDASQSPSAGQTVTKPPAAKQPVGSPDGTRRPEARPADATPVAGAGAVKKPLPPTVASANGGSGSGGSPEAATDDDYAAAAERWRSRMAGGPGGMGGPQAEHGSIGDGEATTGGGGTVVGFEFLSYRQRIFNTIKSNWANAVRHAGLVAAVRFEIAPQGEVLNLELVRSSGDKTYDQSVLRAVQRSSPLPPPPERYRDEFHEVVIDFHSEEEGGRGSG